MTGREPAQLPLPLGHPVSLGVDDFLVAPSNRLAADWIGRWPDWPGPALILVGPSGSGKSHLAALWQARAGARAVDLAALDVEKAAQIAAEFGAAAADDADQVAGDPAREAALLHLYNLIRAAGGHLLLTACAAPSRWGVALPDLESRLNGALLAAIDPPEDELLAAVAVKLFADRQIAIAEEVIPLLVNRAERSLAGIGRAVDALDRVALATGRAITPALARSVLADLA